MRFKSKLHCNTSWENKLIKVWPDLINETLAVVTNKAHCCNSHFFLAFLRASHLIAWCPVQRVLSPTICPLFSSGIGGLEHFMWCKLTYCSRLSLSLPWIAPIAHCRNPFLFFFPFVLASHRFSSFLSFCYLPLSFALVIWFFFLYDQFIFWFVSFI